MTQPVTQSVNQPARQAASPSRTAERAAIQEAIERLLAGTPTRSTGALTVLQLAAEAGVKRWVLTHKHPDLTDQFRRRSVQTSGVPAAYQPLHTRVSELEATNRQLRQTVADLSERNQVYAQVIRDLAAQLDHDAPRPAHPPAAPQRPELHTVPPPG